MVTIEFYSHPFVIYMMVLVQNLANMNYFLYLCKQNSNQQRYEDNNHQQREK